MGTHYNGMVHGARDFAFIIALIPLSSPLLPHVLSLRAEAMGLTELLHFELLMGTSKTAGLLLYSRV